ncbi:NAD-dependent epimerase/dehydratase family protein [Paenibacillus agricola]|uniref:NAD(P)-dependent oxidoreductase n=1 Tax=Paenibacillus agricola TaxID=2716264 RepID=A0ABX0JID9_9BACL|nr:NAD(P)-dependent oxidoreductase [Paenibacillus agricola]NHN35373.1 NAD(P)-dependent oxidoreductase [Paenibacillus agricola]
MTILITGASGDIGSKLAERLVGASQNDGQSDNRNDDRNDGQKNAHEVVCLSRHHPQMAVPHWLGNFDSFEDLQQLDALQIKAVVHLAAVTGGCSEEDGLSVNVLGTRRLYRYLYDHGCRKFITASSIAAVGCLSPAFTPLQLPIPDEHPCLAEDAYDMSKAMVEQLTHYFHRKHGDIDFINYRLGAVVDDELWRPKPITASSTLRIPFTNLSAVFVSDVLDALVTAIEAPHQPGVRTYNVVGADASCDEPVAELLLHKLGVEKAQVLLSHYQIPGNGYATIFDMRRIKAELGFEPKRSMRPGLQIEQAQSTQPK